MTNRSAASGFSTLSLDPRLLESLARLGYEEPTSVQREAIPPLLAGKDLLSQAATGTGKTAAFALPPPASASVFCRTRNEVDESMSRAFVKDDAGGWADPSKRYSLPSRDDPMFDVAAAPHPTPRCTRIFVRTPPQRLP